MPSPAWVTPAHMTASTPATAANVNTHETDLLYLKDRQDNSPFCELYHNTTQSIGNGSDTAVAFNSELADTATLHDTVTNNSRITIPTGEGGTWIFSCRVEFAANATGQRKVMLRRAGSVEYPAQQFDAAAGGNVTKLAVCHLMNIAAADYVEVVVSQNSGGALNLSATPYFSAQRVR